MTQPTDKKDVGLDTSGEVWWPGPEGHSLEWSDLTPFTQGYTAEYLKAAGATRFDQLAPDTLAAIMKDCARFSARHPSPDRGAAFWRARQSGALPNYPPLSPSISPEGQPS